MNHSTSGESQSVYLFEPLRFERLPHEEALRRSRLPGEHARPPHDSRLLAGACSH